MGRKKEYTYILEVIEPGQSEARKPKEQLELKMTMDLNYICFVNQTENEGITEVITVHGMAFLIKSEYMELVNDWATEDEE